MINLRCAPAPPTGTSKRSGRPALARSRAASAAPSLYIYPNPIAEPFTLQFGLSQKEKVSVSLFDMQGKLVEKLLDNHAHRLAPKNITLEINIPPDLTILGDENLLLAALANILENSIHFSPENSIIKIKAVTSNGKAIITLTDQGIGIPDYALPRVFDRFYSISRPDSMQKSSGLGLAFVKEIIELHQGTITLENVPKPNQGTCATIVI